MVIRIGIKQLAKLETHVLDMYVDEMQQYCLSTYPRQMSTLHENTLRSAIQAGIAQAQQVGFTQRGSVRFYLDLMIVLGARFATDPQYPWVIHYLVEHGQHTQIEQADGLYLKLNAYLEAITGENGIYDHAIAKNLAQFDPAIFLTRTEYFESLVLGILQRLYKGKAMHTEESALKQLVQSGLIQATKNGYSTRSSQGLYVLLMYLYGHEFHSDPFLPFELASNSHYNSQTNTYHQDQGAQKLLHYAQRWPFLKMVGESHFAQEKI